MRLSIYFVIIFVDTACVAMALLLGVDPQQYPRVLKFITWFSCAHLALIAGVSLCSLYALDYKRVDQEDRSKEAWFWFICCAGFLYLSADEGMGLHQKLDFWLHQWLKVHETSLTDRLDDLIVLIYGIIALFVVLKFYRNVWEEKNMGFWLMVGFGLFFTMSFFDFLSNDEYFYPFFMEDRSMDKRFGILLGILEDSFKLFAEAAFLIGFLEGFQSVLRKYGG